MRVGKVMKRLDEIDKNIEELKKEIQELKKEKEKIKRKVEEKFEDRMCSVEWTGNTPIIRLKSVPLLRTCAADLIVLLKEFYNL